MSSRLRLVVVAMTSVNLGLGGTVTTLTHAAVGTDVSPESVRMRTVEFINPEGKVVAIPARKGTPSSNDISPALVALVRDLLEDQRRQLPPNARESSLKGIARAAERIDRALTLLAIAAATDATERHTLIRQLRVEIVDIRAQDDRAGGYREFVARGRTRVRVSASDDGDSAPAAGPAEQPDGSGATSRPPAAEDLCYDEDLAEWGECAEEWEMEDALILAADMEAELATYEADNNEAETEYLDYCAINFCEEGQALPTPGPNVPSEMLPQCLADITAAAGTIWTAVEKRVALYGLASRPLGTVARSALAAAVASSTFWTGLAAVATGVALYCVYTAMSVPVSSAIALFSKSLGDGDLRIGRLTQGQLHVALDRAEATR